MNTTLKQIDTAKNILQSLIDELQFKKKDYDTLNNALHLLHCEAVEGVELKESKKEEDNE